MTFTRALAPEKPVTYLVKPYLEGAKDRVIDTMRKTIIIKESGCKLTVVTPTISQTFKSEDGKVTAEIPYSTLESWFKVTDSKGAKSDKCKVKSYTLKVENKDPYIEKAGHCVLLAMGTTPKEKDDYVKVTDAKDSADCQKKCKDKGDACKGF